MGKYIKLFENFDQYNFGVPIYTDLEEQYLEMLKLAIDLSDDEITYIKAAINYDDVDVVENYYKNVGSMFIDVLVDEGEYYYVYSLGDYCYCLAVMDDSSDDVMAIIPFDGLDSIISHIIEIIEHEDGEDPDEDINESFDKYDFTKISGADLETEWDLMMGQRNNFEQEDIDLIKSELTGLCHIYRVPNNSGEVDHISISNGFMICYLGDYCYNLTTMVGSARTVIELENFDGLDALISSLKNKLNT